MDVAQNITWIYIYLYDVHNYNWAIAPLHHVMQTTFTFKIINRSKTHCEHGYYCASRRGCGKISFNTLENVSLQCLCGFCKQTKRPGCIAVDISMCRVWQKQKSDGESNSRNDRHLIFACTAPLPRTPPPNTHNCKLFWLLNGYSVKLKKVN